MPFLRRQGQRPSVRLAVIKQVALITLQHLLGDIGGLIKAALVAPRNKSPDYNTTAATVSSVYPVTSIHSKWAFM